MDSLPFALVIILGFYRACQYEFSDTVTPNTEISTGGEVATSHPSASWNPDAYWAVAAVDMANGNGVMNAYDFLITRSTRKALRFPPLLWRSVPRRLVSSHLLKRSATSEANLRASELHLALRSNMWLMRRGAIKIASNCGG